MNRELRQKWIDALRSGSYEQSRGTLAEPCHQEHTGYCCLGVLLCVTGEFRHINQFKDHGSLKHMHRLDLLGGDRDHEGILISMNDQGRTFDEIANWIEQRVSVE